MRYLNTKDMTAKGLGARASLYRYVEEGKLPPPIKLGTRTLWIEHEVDEWIARANGRETAA